MLTMRDRLMCQYAAYMFACCKVMCCYLLKIIDQTKLFLTGVWANDRMCTHVSGIV